MSCWHAPKCEPVGCQALSFDNERTCRSWQPPFVSDKSSMLRIVTASRSWPSGKVLQGEEVSDVR